MDGLLDLGVVGVELEGELRLPASLSVGVSSAIVNSRFKGETSLRNNRVPQVPKYNVGVNVRYGDEKWIASGQFRVTGAQFEDDLNLFTLRRANVLDIYGSRRFAGKAVRKKEKYVSQWGVR